MNPEVRLKLPDFCAPRTVLAVAVIVELAAIMLTLADRAVGSTSWVALARTSLLLQWIGLGSAAVLCLARGFLSRLDLLRACAVALGLILVVDGVVSAIALQLSAGLGMAGAGLLTPEEARGFVLRNLAIGAILGALALRYVYVGSEWRRNVEMQAQARIQTLQARIRPHFLFNSMNTIASLTRSDPAQAEAAVQDLADLFRATLSEQRGVVTLAEELEIARTYERIEQLRLGPRLKVLWQVDALPRQARMPGLLLQPLLENAIFHGVEPRHDGGTITVEGHLEGDSICLSVRNPLPEGEVQIRAGNRYALANIRERLHLTYGNRGVVDAGRLGDEFLATLRFPCDTSAS
ncbi:MAG TPA: histidine kinase [Steroidobacteraceae bacterium]|nr:histidine kinase [Steroidobacteraceae bacterium]